MKQLLAALAFLLAPALTHASPITFGFTGVASFGFGPFSGTYTFDSVATPDANYAYTTYFFMGAPYGMTIDVGALHLSFPVLQISIQNDLITGDSRAPTPIADLYFVRGSTGTSSDPFGQFFLHDCYGTALSDENLLSVPNVDLFRPSCSAGDEVVIHGPGIPFAAGQMTGVFLASVTEKIPEPASWWLMGLGLMAMVRVGRRTA